MLNKEGKYLQIYKKISFLDQIRFKCKMLSNKLADSSLSISLMWYGIKLVSDMLDSSFIQKFVQRPLEMAFYDEDKIPKR